LATFFNVFRDRPLLNQLRQLKKGGLSTGKVRKEGIVGGVKTKGEAIQQFVPPGKTYPSKQHKNEEKRGWDNCSCENHCEKKARQAMAKGREKKFYPWNKPGGGGVKVLKKTRKRFWGEKNNVNVICDRGGLKQSANRKGKF